jgi:hypothetical protein
MDDKKLHELLRHSSSRTWEWAPECPDEHEIAAYVEGAIGESTRDAVELHLADCERCTLLVGTLSRLEIESAEAVPAETMARAASLVAEKPNRWPRYLPHLAAAAVLVLAVGVLFNTREGTPVQAESDYRTTRGTDAQPEMRILSPASGAGVGADGLLVRWTAIPGTRYYVVRIVTASGSLVAEHRVTDTEWRPGGDVSLHAGEEYYVRVEAYPAAGPSMGSVHVPFTVRDDG